MWVLYPQKGEPHPDFPDRENPFGPIASAKKWCAHLPEQVLQLADNVLLVDPPLAEGIPVPDGYCAILEGLAIYGNTIRGADLVLSAVASADRPFFVVEDVPVGFQFCVNLTGDFRHPVLFDQGKDGRFDGGQPWVES